MKKINLPLAISSAVGVLAILFNMLLVGVMQIVDSFSDGGYIHVSMSLTSMDTFLGVSCLIFLVLALFSKNNKHSNVITMGVLVIGIVMAFCTFIEYISLGKIYGYSAVDANIAMWVFFTIALLIFLVQTIVGLKFKKASIIFSIIGAVFGFVCIICSVCAMNFSLIRYMLEYGDYNGVGLIFSNIIGVIMLLTFICSMLFMALSKQKDDGIKEIQLEQN